MADKKISINKQQIAKELRYEAASTFSTLVTSAFGLVAAFAWNEAVKDAISRYIAAGDGLKSKLIYALLVTLLAIVISYQMGKIAGRYKLEKDSDKKE